MATTTTTAIAAARLTTHFLFHHPLFTTHKKNISLPLLKTHLPKPPLLSFSSSYCTKPLYCSAKHTVEFGLLEGIEENPDRKLDNFEKREVPKLTIEENVENPDRKLGDFVVPKLTVKENEENPERKLGNFVEREVPKLTVKEKKEICSYANSLGDKLKSQQVGKSGVTNNVVFAFDETLEANELLKLKIHRTCPGELEDVVDQLERATGSVVVGQIGRTVIFYRPSITKLKAEKKKEQARKLYAQKRAKAQAAFLKREQVPRRTGRGQFTSRRSDKIAS